MYLIKTFRYYTQRVNNKIKTKIRLKKFSSGFFYLAKQFLSIHNNNFCFN
jgi:hypothetical protein